jgi:hexosaminidase
VREVRHAVRLARHGAWRLYAEAGGRTPSNSDLAKDLSEAIEEHRACWRERSRPGGLEDSAAHLERTLESYS